MTQIHHIFSHAVMQPTHAHAWELSQGSVGGLEAEASSFVSFCTSARCHGATCLLSTAGCWYHVSFVCQSRVGNNSSHSSNSSST